jgi:hypothetical protein
MKLFTTRLNRNDTWINKDYSRANNKDYSKTHNKDYSRMRNMANKDYNKAGSHITLAFSWAFSRQ